MTAFVARALRAFFLLAVRIYYKRLEVSGRADIPEGGPVIVVANHPNGLIDPVMLQRALGRKLGILAKSTLFGNPLTRVLMAAFQAIPVFRSRDGEDTQKNEQTFSACRDRLGKGGWLLLFPEGVSHSEPRVLQLKTGAARIALSYASDAPCAGPLRVLPVGLVLDEKETFRSRAVVAVGKAIVVDAFVDAYKVSPRDAVEELTLAIHRGLADCVLEADSEEFRRGLLKLAAWTDPKAQTDPVLCHARAKEFGEAYRDLITADPDRAEAVVQMAREFARLLSETGLEDPSLVAQDSPRLGALGAAYLLLGGPVALVGVMCGWVPYRLVRPLARKMAGAEDDLVSTYKLLLGVAVLGVTYVIEAVLVATMVYPEVGPIRVGVISFLAAALSGGWSVVYFEQVLDRFRAFRLKRRGAAGASEIARRRAELAATIDGLLSGRAR